MVSSVFSFILPLLMIGESMVPESSNEVETHRRRQTRHFRNGTKLVVVVLRATRCVKRGIASTSFRRFRRQRFITWATILSAAHPEPSDGTSRRVQTRTCIRSLLNQEVLIIS